jgi:hypothetical protein
MSLTEATKTELDLVSAIRQAFRQQIEAQRLSKEDLANRLGLLPAGVSALSARVWSTDLAIRIADQMGIPLRFSVNGHDS